MLACKRFKGRHTTENVLSQYEEVLSNYQLGSKVSRVTTDNASNMFKAFSLLKYEQISPASSATTKSLVCSSSDLDSEEPDARDSVLPCR